MAWFKNIAGPLVGTIIARAILTVINALGIYPSKWLAERVMDAPPEAWIKSLQWAVAACFGIGIYAVIAWGLPWWRHKHLKSREMPIVSSDSLPLDIERSIINSPNYGGVQIAGDAHLAIEHLPLDAENKQLLLGNLDKGREVKVIVAIQAADALRLSREIKSFLVENGFRATIAQVMTINPVDGVCVDGIRNEVIIGSASSIKKS